MEGRAAHTKPSDAEEEPAVMVEPIEKKSKKLATIFKTAGRNAQEQSEALPYVARTQRTYQQCINRSLPQRNLPTANIKISITKLLRVKTLAAYKMK